MEKKKVYDSIISWIEDFIYGFGASITISFIWEQIIHIFAVVFGGVLLTIANHYVRKWLSKK
jgi:hypothetical protein